MMDVAKELIEEVCKALDADNVSMDHEVCFLSLPLRATNRLADVFGRQLASSELGAMAGGGQEAGFDELGESGLSREDLAELWSKLAGSNLRLSKLVSSLRQAMEGRGDAKQAAATAYLGMLLSPNCPLYSLFDTLAFLALLKCIQEGCTEKDGRNVAENESSSENPSRRGARKQATGARRTTARVHSIADDSDDEGPDFENMEVEETTQSQVDTNGDPDPSAQQCTTAAILFGLQKLLEKFHFADQAESRKALIEVLCELSRSSAWNGGHSVADLAYAALLRLFEPAHGATIETAVTVMRALTPNLLLTFESTGGAPETAQGRPARRAEQVKSRAAVQVRAIDFLSKDMMAWARSKEQGRLAAMGRKGSRLRPDQSGEETEPCPPDAGDQATTPGKGVRRQGAGSTGKDVRLAVTAALRHLSLKAADLKADGRALAVEAIGCMAGRLEVRDLHKFAEFVLRLSRNAKVSLRQFAVELALGLLTKLPDPFSLEHPPPAPSPAPPSPLLTPLSPPFPLGVSPGSRSQLVPPPVSWPWGSLCFTALLQRCSDKAPQVRSKALGNLALAWDHAWAEVRNRPLILNLLGLGAGQDAGAAATSSPGLNPWGLERRSPTPMTGTLSPPTSLAQPGLGASPLTPGAGYTSLGPLLRRRCGDTKAAVRRAALSMMEQLVRAGGTAPNLSPQNRPPATPMHPEATPSTPQRGGVGAFPTAADLAVMENACGDPALSVRRAALSAVSEVFRSWPGEAAVANGWAQAVLPLLADTEQTVQDRCLDLFEELVLGRLAQAGGTVVPPRGDTRAAGNQAVPKEVATVLGALAHQGGPSRSCIARLCSLLAAKGRVKPGVAKALQRVIIVSERWGTGLGQDRGGEGEWPAPRGAWLLLAELSAHTPAAVSWEFLQSRWEKLGKSEGGGEGGDRMQGACATVGQRGGGASSSAAAEDRGCLLKTIVNAAARFPEEAAAQLAVDLLGKLRRFSLAPTDVGPHLEALVVLGKRSSQGAAQMGEWASELVGKAGDLLGAYVLSRSASHRPNALNPPPAHPLAGGCSVPAPSERSVEAALFTVGALVQARSGPLSPRLVTLVQSLVAEGPEGRYSPQVTAHAWVALGKLCLADERLAKRCMPLLVQELEVSTSPAVRNNIMVAMADLCVRYTALVDGSVARLAACLRDPCELVRRQTLLLFASLLQREYVKWRGPLFHRFLRALVDDSPAVRHLAGFLFREVLAVKAPLLAYTHFVEALSVLNDCDAHHSETVRAATQKDRDLFSIKGSDAAAQGQRMVIYTALLTCMAPEHRFATTAKLCAEILGGIAEGALPLAGCEGLLLDALKVLACKEIRGGAKARGDADDEGPDEGATGAGTAVSAAKGRLVSQLMKKNLMENVVPILIELKRVLESARSPLLGPLMECTRMMLKEYKAELEEIFAADKQLAKEILYDIQKHETAAKAAKAAAAAAATARMATPASAAMGPPGTARTGTPLPRGTPGSHFRAAPPLSARTAARKAGRIAAPHSPAQQAALDGGRRGTQATAGGRPQAEDPRMTSAGEGHEGERDVREDGQRTGRQGSPMHISPQATPRPPGTDLQRPGLAAQAGGGEGESSFEFEVPVGPADPPTPQQTRRLAGVFDGLANRAGQVPPEQSPVRGGVLEQELSFTEGGRLAGEGVPGLVHPGGGRATTPARPRASFAEAFLSPLQTGPSRTPGVRVTLATPMPPGRPPLATPLPARTPVVTPGLALSSAFRSPTGVLAVQTRGEGTDTPCLRAMSVPRLRPGASQWAERQATVGPARGHGTGSGAGERPAPLREATVRDAVRGPGEGRAARGHTEPERENRVPLPSPLPVRVYATVAAPGDSQGRADVLLFSPDKALPPLRQWNLRPPGEQETLKRQQRTPTKSPLSASLQSASPSPTALRDLQSKRLRSEALP